MDKVCKKVALTLAVVPLSILAEKAQAQTVPIFISATQELNFGAFSAGAGGTVTISTAGARSVSGSVVPVGAGGFERQGNLLISGEANFAIDVVMTAPSFTVSEVGGDTMAVNNFDLGGGAGNPVVVTIPTGATSINVPVGGRLTVGSPQAEGTYSGSYSITANYQ
jgi:hypothetical protein